ncbi:hypothetical protein ACFVAJ_19190 [Agromyces sp. NPDC057679]|uniref:hypothetical protein n=1 Tax=Agromyces sp. NPDC057679 TaxID=3346207 RepID=UPI00366B7C29
MKFGTTVTVDTPEEAVWEVAIGTPTVNVTDQVAEAAWENPVPEPGYVYAAVPVSMKFLGGKTGDPAELKFTFRASDGTVSSRAFVVFDGQLADVVEVPEGTSTMGTVILQVPADKPGVWGVEHAVLGGPVYFAAG